MSRSHTYRMAIRKNIENPEQLTTQECVEGIRLAKIRIKDLRNHAVGLRRQHLGSQLQTAITTGDEETQRNIRNRMRQEYSKLAWRRINRVTCPPSGRACLQAQEFVNGQLITHTDKIGVENTIQRECAARFRLGHSAPISRSLLGEEVGYLTDCYCTQNNILHD